MMLNKQALVALSVVVPTAFACSLCPRNGTYLDFIRPTSNDKLLAATLGVYNFDPFSPVTTENATINLETGVLTKGSWPTGVDIYPPGLARSEPPTDSSAYSLTVKEDFTEATLTTTGMSTTFALPDANTGRFVYGWFISSKFKLAYMLYSKAESFSEVILGVIPIMGRTGPVTYQSLSTQGFAGGDIDDEMRLTAYDDVQVAEVPIVCCLCVVHEIMFYDDTLGEMRPGLTDLGLSSRPINAGGYTIQYGNNVPEDTVVYQAKNVHECSFFVGGPPAPEAFFLTVTDLSTGDATRLDLSLEIEQCPAVGCCEFDCCGPGTSWERPHCVLDAASPGFDGAYPSEYLVGCFERVCCESSCCSPGTVFDQNIACCVPSPAETCVASGGVVTTASCCQSVEAFPPTCAPGPCGCAPEFSQEIEVCDCPDDTCFDGTECSP